MEKELNTRDIRIVAIILLVGMAVVIATLLWAERTIAQNTKPAVHEYKLTEVQLLKLQVQQKDAIILKAQLDSVQKEFQAKVSELMSTAQKFKLENGWPPETQFDPDKLTFSAPPAKEDKKP